MVPSRRAFLKLGLTAASVLALPRLAHADGAPPSLDDRLAAIAKARATTTTLQGPFTQTKTLGLMATQLRSTGTLWLQTPAKIRWELAAPDSVTYWMLPEGLAYKGKNGQGRLPVTDKMAPQLNDLKAFLAGDLGALKARYTLREVPADGGQVAIEATPIAAAGAFFKQVVLTLDPDLVRPRKIVLVEGVRDKTEIAFGELKKNAPIDPALLTGP
jgi:outer membrane lipoprotein-sorting protein